MMPDLKAKEWKKLDNGLEVWDAKEGQGDAVKPYPPLIPTTNIYIAGTPVSTGIIFVVIAAVILMVGLDQFVNRTRVGRAMRATAQDREAAMMMGVDVNRIIAITFFIGSALAGAAGVVYGMYVTHITWDMGFIAGLKAFTAAVLGGIGNVPGAMLGGLMLGVIESLGTWKIGAEYKDLFAFAILVLVLIVKPSGLLGEQVATTQNCVTPQGAPAAQGCGVAGTDSNATSQSAYDALGRATSVTDPLNRTTHSTYDGAGNQLTVTDPLNHTTTSTYDSAGNQLTKTDPLGNTWHYTYDANGNETGNNAGKSFSYNAADQTTNINGVSMGYRGAGQRERYLNGATWYQYDLTGLSATTAPPQGGGSAVTTYFTRTPVDEYSTSQQEGDLVGERTTSATYYYLFDGLGSVVAVPETKRQKLHSTDSEPSGNKTLQTEPVPTPVGYV